MYHAIVSSLKIASTKRTCAKCTYTITFTYSHHRERKKNYYFKGCFFQRSAFPHFWFVQPKLLMFYCYFLPNIFRNAWLFSVAVVITRSVCHCGFQALTLIVIYAHSFAFYLFGVFPYSTQTHNRVHIVATKLTHITYLTHCAFFHFVSLFPPTHLAR